MLRPAAVLALPLPAAREAQTSVAWSGGWPHTGQTL